MGTIVPRIVPPACIVGICMYVRIRRLLPLLHVCLSDRDSNQFSGVPGIVDVKEG